MQPVFRARKSCHIVTAIAVTVVVLATLSGVASITHRALSTEGYACRIITHVANWGKSTRTVTHSETRYRSFSDRRKREGYVRTWRTRETKKYGPSVTSIPAFALPELKRRSGSPSMSYGIRYNAGIPAWKTDRAVVEGSRIKFRHDLIVSSEPDCVGEKEIVPIGTLEAMEIENNAFGRWTPDYGSWINWHFYASLDIEMGLEEVMVWLNRPPPTEDSSKTPSTR